MVTTGEVVRRAGVNASTVCSCGAAGVLLPPVGRISGQRRYEEDRLRGITG